MFNRNTLFHGRYFNFYAITCKAGITMYSCKKCLEVASHPPRENLLKTVLYTSIYGENFTIYGRYMSLYGYIRYCLMKYCQWQHHIKKNVTFLQHFECLMVYNYLNCDKISMHKNACFPVRHSRKMGNQSKEKLPSCIYGKVICRRRLPCVQIVFY